MFALKFDIIKINLDSKYEKLVSKKAQPITKVNHRPQSSKPQSITNLMIITKWIGSYGKNHKTPHLSLTY